MTKSIPLLSSLPMCHAQRHGYIWLVCEAGHVIILHFWNIIVVGKWQMESLEMWRFVCHRVKSPALFIFQKKIELSTSGSEVPDAHRTNCLKTALHKRWQPRLNSKPSAGSRLLLKCDGTRAETWFRLCSQTDKYISFGLVRASVQSTAGSRGVHISGSNAGYTMFRRSVKGTGYTLHSKFSLSLPFPCVTVCHHFSTGVYIYPPDEGSVYFEL